MTLQMPDPKQEFTQLFGSTRKGAHLARVTAAQHLAAWGYVSDVAEVAALVVSELAANAVAHCRTPGRDFLLCVAVVPGRPVTLRIEVSDACADRRPAPRPRVPADDAESGRGLLLVHALALGWGVTERPYGKTVWAVCALAADGAAGSSRPVQGDVSAAPPTSAGEDIQVHPINTS